ncbi:MAG: hypothetical protein PHP54_04615 [Clostridia bacterium]|nr:hypothetical protein [Clostridia bacterium]
MGMMANQKAIEIICKIKEQIKEKKSIKKQEQCTCKEIPKQDKN